MKVRVSFYWVCKRVSPTPSELPGGYIFSSEGRDQYFETKSQSWEGKCEMKHYDQDPETSVVKGIRRLRDYLRRLSHDLRLTLHPLEDSCKRRKNNRTTRTTTVRSSRPPMPFVYTRFERRRQNRTRSLYGRGQPVGGSTRS